MVETWAAITKIVSELPKIPIVSRVDGKMIWKIFLNYTKKWKNREEGEKYFKQTEN